MEGDLWSAAKVATSTAAAMAYAQFAAARTPPGRYRLLALLPAITLLPFLPFSFSSVHLRGISAFFLAWLSVFKLLLLSSGHPPLSPSLPLRIFIATASLPIKLRPTTTPTPTPATHHAIHAVLLTAIIPLYAHRRRFHPYLLLSLYSLHIYLALELVLAAAALLAASLPLEPLFDAPYLSISLADFWGRRWNLMVTSVLRPSVYGPVRARCGRAAGVAATFLVSGLMHEVMFYYLTSAGPTWEVTYFFIIHGAGEVAEGWARRAGWRPLPAALATPLALGFVAVTAFWLFFPPILRSGADERVLEECEAAMGLVVGSGQWLAGRMATLVKWFG